MAGSVGSIAGNVGGIASTVAAVASAAAAVAPIVADAAHRLSSGAPETAAPRLRNQPGSGNRAWMEQWMKQVPAGAAPPSGIRLPPPEDPVPAQESLPQPSRIAHQPGSANAAHFRQILAMAQDFEQAFKTGGAQPAESVSSADSHSSDDNFGTAFSRFSDQRSEGTAITEPDDDSAFQRSLPSDASPHARQAALDKRLERDAAKSADEAAQLEMQGRENQLSKMRKKLSDQQLHSSDSVIDYLGR